MSEKAAMTWLLILIVIFALITVACVSFRSKDAGSASAIPPSVMPNSENDKVILVKGWDESEIKKIIRDFIQTYERNGYPAYTIEHHKESGNLYRLTFPQDIHPRLFTFLVNYLAYPFDLDLKNRSIIVGGRTTLSPGFDQIDSQFVGKNAILYIPENDRERSVVYLRTESGVTLANSFTELKWKRVNDARLSYEVKNLIGGS